MTDAKIDGNYHATISLPHRHLSVVAGGNDRKASAGCWFQSYRAPDQRPTGAPESRPGDQKRAAFGATCVVREKITLRREIHQGSLQDSPPTKLLVRAWSQASQSKPPGRRG